MRDRKIKTTACVLLAALLLGGCGEQPIELTEQEEQTIVDYAAHVVSKYNIKQQDGIVRLSKSEETTGLQIPRLWNSRIPLSRCHQKVEMQQELRRMRHRTTVCP